MNPLPLKLNKILVANRGEIAIRILRAVAEMHIPTVAIYSFEDRYSLHRYKADEAYQVGDDSEPLKPYLDIEAILALAKRVGADAIHPGYGFLSENVQFVRRCEEEGIVFIGPRSSVMDQLGDKVRAKEVARRAGVPLIPDSKQQLLTLTDALPEARRIGYPIMIKAAAGGGGRGMRVARNEEDLARFFQEARQEAKTAFGDDTVFLEKFVENPKHIEVQILGDNYGNIVHFYERDCSVQRRFQKVVEIAPSTLPDTLRFQILEYALRIAREVQYNNAGTVEFLVDKEDNIYFIEVNPRIQVEHTITEEITGYDLVSNQIHIAAGKRLSDPEIAIESQDSISCNGYAIQCRVTTEDPGKNFRPDYGEIIAYRSPGGFGIRLDGGSIYAGMRISPFFDSMLVKVTGWGRTLEGAAKRLDRSLREFRIRGVSTNISFLLNVVNHPVFQAGACNVGFIGEHPELFETRKGQDRGTKTLRYLAHVSVNGNSNVGWTDPRRIFRKATVPGCKHIPAIPKGYRDLLKEKGREDFCKHILETKPVLYTDTTLRDAHQSLLATRMRTQDMLKAAESYAKNHPEVFSLEMWGGATFDVSLRFLRESPWERLRKLRAAIPNILFQMLLRGSNAVGYTAYPNNLIERFIIKAAENGIDLFRIFDSLNWVEAMRFSIRTVRNQTGALAEACICYTGDISDPTKTKYTLSYYLDLARQLEDEGAHLLAIKDMAGLLKPQAAEVLIGELKHKLSIPVHLHTHDTSSIQAATYLKAIQAGVDIVDVALGSMSGLTSQPSFNGLVAMMQGHERECPINLPKLNEFSNYWEVVRGYYYPFETELRAGTAEVYEHEIPGGQYSNLLPQARALGLEDRLDEIKHMYARVNMLFGDIVKVTPSSKVVGDMSLFMVANNLTEEDLWERGATISFPDSVKGFFRGDLGQPYGGFPEKLQQLVLKGEKPLTDHPNAHLPALDLDREYEIFSAKFDGVYNELDFLSYKLYPKVFEDYHAFRQDYGEVSNIPTLAYFYPMKSNEEIIVEIEAGKNLLIEYMYKTQPNENGFCTVFFKINGQTRSIEVQDQKLAKPVLGNKKATREPEVASPLQGRLSKILVEVGSSVHKNQPLFVVEAMKMESTITAPRKGIVQQIVLKERTMVEQNDIVVILSELDE